MANSLFTAGAQRTLTKQVDWANDSIKAVLVSGDYFPNLITDEFLSTVSPFVVNSAMELTNKTVVRGVFDADDVTWARVAAGGVVKGVVLFKDTGEPATSPLLCYIDAITGFPVTTNGSDITVQWDNGAFKIFSL